MADWLAVRTVGTFRRGRTYTTEQLGVLGRMAVKCGHIIPTGQVPAALAPAAPVKKRVPRRKRGWVDDDGIQGGVQAGSSPRLLDNPGA